MPKKSLENEIFRRKKEQFEQIVVCRVQVMAAQPKFKLYLCGVV
jgi:hypothetical protein